MTPKEKQRLDAKSARAAISPELVLEKTQKVIDHIKAHHAYKNAQVLFVYSAFGSELDLAALYDDAKVQGKTLSFPVCDGRGNMCAAVPDENGRFQVDRYGIKEPMLAYSRIVPPSCIDLVLTPGVAFDRTGKRIGYGAGYYDRFLPLCSKAVIMGVAFEEQMIDSLNADPHDRSMHSVVTDYAVYTCAL